MSPVAISGVDKQGVAVNGVQVKQALSDANSTVNKGVYEATLLETVDVDLAVGNILIGVNIFGKDGTVVPGVDVSDADALVTDVKDPKTFYSVAAPRKTGTMLTVALADDNPAYPAGYHAGAASLAAVDAHLAVGNIKQGVSIFGFPGTVIPGGTETIIRLSTGNLANGANYTPAVSGVFFSGMSAHYTCRVQYYSTAQAAWWYCGYSANLGVTGIGDGTKFRIINSGTGNSEDYIIFQHYYSLGTYERLRDTTLANGASYTPAVSGFFAVASDATYAYNLRIQLLENGTWYDAMESGGSVSNEAGTLAIGDGTNLRVTNNDGAQRNYVLMHNKLT